MSFLDVPGVKAGALDTSIEAKINDTGSATRGALNATFVPKWKATTAYLAGDKVLSPAGDVVSAIANFTSGASYSAANWNLSPTYTKQEKGAGRFVGKLSGWAPATTALFIGDSTGNWTGEWIDLTLRGIGAAYPNLTTKWHLWQEHITTYGINDTVQTGALLDVVTDTFTRTAADLTGTKPDVGNAVWAGAGWSVDGTSAVWGSGSTMTKIDSGLAGDFEATWTFECIPSSTTTGQTFRFVGRITPTETVRLYAEITASGTGWTVRLYKKMAALNTTLSTLPIAGNDIHSGLTGATTLNLKMTLAGDQLSFTINGSAYTTASVGTLTSADLAELAGGTSYGVQGGIATAKITNFAVKTREPASVLHFYNASIPGAGIPYFTSAMLDTMTPADDVDLIVFNLAHNAGATDGATYGPTYEAFIDATAKRFPNAGIAVSSQNPEMHGTLASYPAAQFSRNAWIKEMCARRGFTYLPGMEAFMAVSNPYKYIKADGMHPTDAVEHPTDHGQQLWANAALAQLKLRGLTRLP